MKFIPTNVHGIIDYLFGALMLALPWIFDIGYESSEVVLLGIVGIAIFIYSMVTDYEAGIIRILPVRTHLALDILAGICLVTLPSILGITEGISHCCVWPGLFAIVAALVTRTEVSRGEVYE